jgi:hypothetical protein
VAAGPTDSPHNIVKADRADVVVIAMAEELNWNLLDRWLLLDNLLDFLILVLAFDFLFLDSTNCLPTLWMALFLVNIVHCIFLCLFTLFVSCFGCTCFSHYWYLNNYSGELIVLFLGAR